MSSALSLATVPADLLKDPPPSPSSSSSCPKKKKREKQRSIMVAAKGVRLKHFEQTLLKLLPYIEPRYVPLAALSSSSSSALSSSWMDRWEKELPAAARVEGNLPGQLTDPQRASRKEDQIQSLLRCIFALIPEKKEEEEEDFRSNQSSSSSSSSSPFTIVDFGGGSGHLSIPLALLLPACRIVCVDLKQKSLDFLKAKARACMEQQKHGSGGISRSKQSIPHDHDHDHDKLLTNRTAIPNLWTFAGDIESYKEPFQIGVALHVCGEATDIVLRKCGQMEAHVVVAPCCVGKLNRQKKNPYIYHATAQNAPTIQYPQSQRFQQCLPCSSANKEEEEEEAPDDMVVTTTSMVAASDWDALASAADYNQVLDIKDRRHAARRTAKSLLETDRQLYLEETFPYKTVLTTMDPRTASPKNDILVGYYCGNQGTKGIPKWLVDHSYEDNQDIIYTKEHLIGKEASLPATANAIAEVQATTKNQVDSIDWSWKEEEEIRKQLNSHFALISAEDDPASETTLSKDQPSIFVFPTGMGGRKRKLVHYVAEQLGLAHWCVGKKYAEKTVAVRKKYVGSEKSSLSPAKIVTTVSRSSFPISCLKTSLVLLCICCMVHVSSTFQIQPTARFRRNVVKSFVTRQEELPDYGKTPVEVDKIRLSRARQWRREDLFGSTLINQTMEELAQDKDFQDTEQRSKSMGAQKMSKEERLKRRRALDDLGILSFEDFLQDKLQRKDKVVLQRKNAPTVLQINIGLYCNQACAHCHVESSPLRKKEQMTAEITSQCLKLLEESPSIKTLDITGGAPELNDSFRYLVKMARAMRPDLEIIDRCNLTVLQEPGQEDLVQFLKENKVRIVASLPCYSMENVDQQRGNGVFERSIAALLALNEAGYGHPGTGLNLDLVYNPLGAFLPPEQGKLEAKYKEELDENFGILFDNLFTMTNMPIKRFADFLHRRGELKEYMDLLQRNFNVGTLSSLMCYETVSIGYDGKIYDCDFNQQLGYAMGADGVHEGGLTVFDLDSFESLQDQKIRTDNHCFGCTAGMGSS